MRTLRDPAAEEIDLNARERIFFGVCGRHAKRAIGGGDTLDDFARFRVSRVDRVSAACERGGRRRFDVEAEFRFAMRGIGAMTSEAAVRKERANVAVELNRRSGKAGG